MSYLLVCTISVIPFKPYSILTSSSETTGPKYNPLFRLIEESSQKEYNHYC